MSVRVLWVTAEAPDHERGGGSIRQAHLLDGLVRAGAEVDLLLAGTLSDPAVAGAVSSVEEVAVPPRRVPSRRAVRRARDVWRVAGARLPAEVADKRAERAVLGRALGDLRAGSVSGAQRYDVVHVEHLGLAGIVPEGLGRVRSVGVQNVPSRMAEQAAVLAVGRRQRLLLGAEAAAARRFQRRLTGATDVVAVVSEEDGRELLAPAPTRPPAPPAPAVMITPNGVDPDRFPVSPLPAGRSIVFTGTLDFLPNVDAVSWFAHQVLPLVRRRIREADLVVVGRRPVADVAALAAIDGVTVHGDVPAVAPFLEASRVAIVPVRIGTGSRVKALEAMAAGRPVAGTTIGLEGIDAQAGRDVLVGDSPVALAEAVVRLLDDDGLAAQVAGAGRRLVGTRYRWSEIADAFASDLLGPLG
ncbi:MAG TPA: glycosyltransferase [Acidimicrobiales bacterium]|nr:glycosyltransferase [Acidimicrobiales bacterium]